MIEIPPKFSGRPPVNPESRPGWNHSEEIPGRAANWMGAEGLAEDVRYYGQWMRDEAEKRIGHLYPKVEVTPEMVKERPDLKLVRGPQVDGDRMACGRGRSRARIRPFADVDVPLVIDLYVVDQETGQRGVCRADHRKARISV